MNLVKRSIHVLFIAVCLISGTWVEAEPIRKAYEVPGDYREKIDQAKLQFKEKCGYDLIDLEVGWKLEEIQKLSKAFSILPPPFYRLPSLKGLYRLSQISRDLPDKIKEEIPAGVFPSFMSVFKQLGNEHRVYIDDEDPRVEFYSSLFYEDEEDFQNIVHHEMGHAFDVTSGFLTFSREWLKLSGFRVLHLPALDGKEDSDYLFTLLNDANVDVYAPVSTRHSPTYSQTSPQEDFANSVAAYIHYPYFSFTHPRRYQFLKERIFKGKEYFSHQEKAMGFRAIILEDLNRRIKKQDWEGVLELAQEAGRAYFPKVGTDFISAMKETLDDSLDEVKYEKLGIASCFLFAPEALKFRRDLIVGGKVKLKALLGNQRCAQMGRDYFEQRLARFPVENVYFFREQDTSFAQILDPVLYTASARGFQSVYEWKLFGEGDTVPWAEGAKTLQQKNGSVKIDLNKTARREFILPFGKKIILEIIVQRYHPRKFKKILSEKKTIQFVDQPWFNYFADEGATIKPHYPVRPAFKGKY